MIEVAGFEAVERARYPIDLTEAIEDLSPQTSSIYRDGTPRHSDRPSVTDLRHKS